MFECLEEAGANDVRLSVVAPSLVEGEAATMALYSRGTMLGLIELGWSGVTSSGMRVGVVRYGRDVRGPYLSLLASGSLDAVLIDARDRPIDLWRIEQEGFADVFDGLGCQVL